MPSAPSSRAVQPGPDDEMHLSLSPRVASRWVVVAVRSLRSPAQRQADGQVAHRLRPEQHREGTQHQHEVEALGRRALLDWRRPVRSGASPTRRCRSKRPPPPLLLARRCWRGEAETPPTTPVLPTAPIDGVDVDVAVVPPPVLPVLPIAPLLPVVGPMPGLSVVERKTRPKVNDTVVGPCDGRFWFSVTCSAPESTDWSVFA